MNNQSIINLHKTRIALEQRVRALKDPTLTEGKDVSKLLYKMESMLENITQQLQTVEEMPAEISFGDDSEPDHEVEMARSELYRAGQAAVALEKMLHHVSEQQGLEGWVQAKITKAADYLESVYHYLDYEMKGSGMHEAVAAYSPGQDPNDPNGNPNNPQAANPQAPGAPQQNPNSSPTGQQSATPDSGGSTPAVTSPGMVKMAKLDQNKKPSGTPIMVKSADISSKQKQGFFVIGEGKEEKKVVHCSQCGKGFSGGGLKAPHHTGFSHCKDHKGMKVIAEDASAGASSAGAMGSGFGNGFANGGPGTISRTKKKKKVSEGGDYGPHSRGVADGYYGRPANPHKLVKDEQGKSVKVKLTDPEEIKQYMAGHKDDSFGRKDYGESKETGPKFTGYWKGTDKKTPGKKMVGSN